MRAPLEVVKSNNGDVPWTLQLCVPQRTEQSKGHEVVADHNGSRPGRLLEELKAAPVTGVLRVTAKTNQISVERHAPGAQSLLISFETIGAVEQIQGFAENCDSSMA